MAEQQLTITVRNGTVRVEGIGVTGRERLLLGRRPDDALRLITLLHNLCPTAHRLAAMLALGRAMFANDARLLAQEILIEHALVMLRDWPVAMGAVVDGGALRGLANLTPARLQQLESDLFGMGAADFLAMEDSGQIITDAVPVALFQAVAGWPVPASVNSNDPTFFSRCGHDPMIVALRAQQGVTLGLRMLARLREAARLVCELAADRYAPRFHSSMPGVGEVQAARGALVHRVRLQDGVIAQYDIETPTGAMIGPDRFLENLLTDALSAPVELREKALAIALSSADPCLAVELEREAA